MGEKYSCARLPTFSTNRNHARHPATTHDPMSRVTTELPQPAQRLPLRCHCHLLRDKAGRRRHEHDRVRPTAQPGDVRACCEASLHGHRLYIYLDYQHRPTVGVRRLQRVRRHHYWRVTTFAARALTALLGHDLYGAFDNYCSYNLK